MTAEKVIVFLGPTVSVAKARAVLPGAEYRPPAAQGDVFATLADGGCDAIGIVDGVFYQDLPIWHKEILHALASGAAVYGASSMGALRAAECAPFGMVGVGEIFEAYARGELVDDDEVAVAHGGAETGWQPYTESMVNLRATMELAVRAGRITPALSGRFLSFAKEVWFAERTRQSLLDRTDAWARCEDDVAAVRQALEAFYVDQKRADAIMLLEVLRGRPADQQATVAASPPITVSRSHVFDAFIERDRKVERSGTAMRLEEIARYVALHDPDYASIYDRALDRMLVDEFARARGVEATDDQITEELRRIRARLRLSEDAPLAEWLADNDVDEAWLHAQAEREARARVLREWVRIRSGKRLVVRPLLDELRLANRYAAVTQQAAVHYRSRLANGHAGGSDSAQRATDGDAGALAADLIRDQIRSGGWRPEVRLDRFADEAGFAGIEDLLEELAAARAVRTRARTQLEVLAAIFEEPPQ